MVKHSTCITLCRAFPSFCTTLTLGYLSSPIKRGTAAVGKIKLLHFSQKSSIYNTTFISVFHTTSGTIGWCKRHKNVTAPLMLKINQVKHDRVVILGLLNREIFLVRFTWLSSSIDFFIILLHFFFNHKMFKNILVSWDTWTKCAWSWPVLLEVQRGYSKIVNI